MGANNFDTEKGSESYKKRILLLLKPAIPSIAAAIAAIIILVVGRQFNAVSISDIAKSIVFIISASIIGGLVGVLIILIYVMPVLNNITTDITNELRNIKKGLYEFIKNAVILKSDTIGEYSMREIEKMVECDEVWVITPDLSKDMPSNKGEFTFANIVINNIVHRGMCYKFVVPEGNSLRIKTIKKLYDKYPEDVRKRLNFIPIKNDRWNMISPINRNCIIYSPDNLEFLEVYFESPGEERHHWIKAGNSQVEFVVAGILNIVPELITDRV